MKYPSLSQHVHWVGLGAGEGLGEAVWAGVAVVESGVVITAGWRVGVACSWGWLVGLVAPGTGVSNSGVEPRDWNDSPWIVHADARYANRRPDRMIRSGFVMGLFQRDENEFTRKVR
jgi:hypothetical protein